MTKFAYEPHPVSKERKAELRAQGFTILDARFDPNPPVTEEGDANSPAAETPKITREAIAEMDKKGVIELLQAHGVDIDGRTAVESLRAKLIEVMFVG